MTPLSLYVHVPFCTRRCPYCSFYHVHSRDAAMADYVAALEQEIRHAMDHAGPAVRLRTVFVGGGTPSVLASELWDRLLAAIAPYIVEDSLEEFTVELNPEDVTSEQVRYLADAGVSRVSLGIQSMDERAQRQLNRCDPATNQRALDAVLQRFDNFSVDVLLGVPGVPEGAIGHTMDVLARSHPAHFSVYCLEPGGDMSQAVDKFFDAVDPERSADEYLTVCDRLRALGYRHYEISNFARPGRESVHNRVYWTGDNYLGVGPGAHSCVAGQRFSNAPSLDDYLAHRGADRIAVRDADERDSGAAELEEWMLGLRTDAGVSLQQCAGARDVVDDLVGNGLAETDDSRLWLSDRGFLMTNEIVIRLLSAVEQSRC